jgi:hypothetical protein
MIGGMLIRDVNAPLSNAVAAPPDAMPETGNARVAAVAMPAGRRQRKTDR